MKIIIIGPPDCGKSSIFAKLCFDVSKPVQTVGCDYAKMTIIVDSVPREIFLWDIAGSEVDSSLMKIYLRDTLGVFLVCNIESKLSMEEMKRYKEKVDLYCEQYNDKGLPMIILQNKVDLIEKNTNIQDYMLPEFLQNFAADNGCISGYKTSAVSGQGLRDALEAMIREIDQRGLQTYQYRKTIIHLDSSKSENFTKELARMNGEKNKCY